MSKSLVIVESPSKAKTINKILGSRYTVKASMGHVRDLPENRLGLDPDKGFQPQYVVLKGREKVVRELTAAAREADAVYLAPDPDREGEAIAWHLKALLSKAVPSDRFHRVTYNEITAPAIRRAFETPRDLDLRKVDAQQARRVLDRLVGYKVSPLLWRRIRGAASAGRVQSVALRLVCEREKAIREFVPEEYWVLGARVAKRVEPKTPFIVRLAQVDGEKTRVPDAATAEALRQDLDDRGLRVRRILRRQIARRAPPPFITSTLQQAAARALNFSPPRTMRIAQSLYEGVDLGDGPVGLITYMRTDSVAVAREAQESCRAFVAEHFGADYLPERPPVYRSRAGAQEAHEAIRPTDPTRTPDALAGRLPADELKLYRLIWERFVASQMAPAQIAQRTIEVETERSPAARHDFLFRATASEVVFPGWLRAAGVPEPEKPEKSESGEEEDEEQPSLPPLEEGEALDRLEWLADQKFTQPPPRYTDASLVRALEENGIGRPSTYAQILATLTERKYVTHQKKQLVPTELGLTTNEFLVAHLDELFNVKFTAEMEAALDRIEEGEVEWTAMLRDFYERLKGWLRTARGPDGNPEEARDLIAALAQVKEWDAPPASASGGKSGRRRAVGDQAFFESLRQQAETGQRPLSNRQVDALRKLVARYLDRAPALRAVAERWGIAAAPRATAAAPHPDTIRKLDLLRNVRFDPPRTVGRKVFDDAAFAASLRAQVESGRGLTENQERYLDRLLRKYADQIPNFEQSAAALNVGAREAPVEANVDPAAVERLLAAFEKVTEWKPPQKRGNRQWDDQEFFRSVARQFRARGALSPRQFQALRKMAARYRLE